MQQLIRACMHELPLFTGCSANICNEIAQKPCCTKNQASSTSLYGVQSNTSIPRRLDNIVVALRTANILNPPESSPDSDATDSTAQAWALIEQIATEGRRSKFENETIQRSGGSRSLQSVRLFMTHTALCGQRHQNLASVTISYDRLRVGP